MMPKNRFPVSVDADTTFTVTQPEPDVSVLQSDTLDGTRISVLAEEMEVSLELDTLNGAVRMTSQDNRTDEHYEYIGTIENTFNTNEFAEPENLDYMRTYMDADALDPVAKMDAKEAADFIGSDILEQHDILFAENNPHQANPVTDFVKQHGYEMKDD